MANVRLSPVQRRMVFSACVSLLLLGVAARAQGPPEQLFEDGASWQRSRNASGECVWVGREPGGSIVYGWESGCNGVVGAWGYDLDGVGRVDVVVWIDFLPACGGRVARAWQWYDNDRLAEYIASYPSACATTYYSTPRGPQVCSAIAAQLKSRRDNAYLYFLRVASSPDRRLRKKAWHAYNRAELTLQTCQRQAAAAGPSDYHHSR